MKCAWCRFYDGKVCRRRAPRVENMADLPKGGPLQPNDADPMDVDAVWPRVKGGDWCGEYEPRRGKPSYE